jgi:2,3-bisphosphoglycerate-independent phosphoglycerate mutase
MLLILDGWGYAAPGAGNAVDLASTPNMDRFYRQYPWALLNASGEAVGLPPGQIGNSEVGHLNLGAGRIVYQELTRINRCIESGEFFANEVLLEAMEAGQERLSGVLHLVGLVSDGGVHSHYEHLLGLFEMAQPPKS